MSGYHFAAQNPGLRAYTELLRGQRGYPLINVVTCDLSGRLLAIAWDDECGWNYLAFTAKGRRMQGEINAAIGLG